MQTPSKALAISLMAFGMLSPSFAADPVTASTVSVEEGKVYVQDGFGAAWTIDVGNDGLWIVPEMADPAYTGTVKVREAAGENSLVVGSTQSGKGSYVGIGTETPQARLDVKGQILTSDLITTTYTGVTTTGNGLRNLLVMSNNNTNESLISDAGFQVRNAREGFEWNFRTAEAYDDGFMATKAGTGGAELVVRNGTSDYRNVTLELGNGAYCDGVWHDASSRSFKEGIEALDEAAALEAFAQLQPVTYVYKSNPTDPKVGFIAEDVPALVADPGRKSISTIDIVAVLTKVIQKQQRVIESQSGEIADLKASLPQMQARLDKMETILTMFDAAKAEGVSVSLNAK